MSIIKLLPENLVNQIAAGEVVERPASVVKELTENSIDAGADRIVVDIKDAGITFIKVSDNGLGMSREDTGMCVARHATSKISSEADLWKINTMGFRGEALPSIASVSKMIIKSKRVEDISGTEISITGGNVASVTDIGIPVGTSVEVYDLFFNTPARQKFLKKESTELGHITTMFDNIALANPHIAFKLIHNEKVISDFPKSTDLISRIADIFGGNTADAMLPVFYGGSELSIDGFIGKPLLSRSTSQHQYFFVNGRYIQHYLFANTIKSAYHSMLMENKKPVFVINIKINPAMVDVNVHPRKTEVRFADQQALNSILYSAVKTVLEKSNLIPKAFVETQRYMSDSLPKEVSFGNKPRFSAQDSINFSRDILMDREHDSTAMIQKEPVLKSIVQISDSYIVAKNDEGLVLIDQHAAHERVRYEELMNQFSCSDKKIQPLLVPLQMECTSTEIAQIEENIDVFKNLGFEIENFGGNTFNIYSVPSFFSGEDIEQVMKGVLDDIENEKNPSRFYGNVETVITYMACRSAIKFGQKLSIDEMQSLIVQIEKLKLPYTCPHGRPTMISLTLSELEKMFGRK
ncbi:MAG: DNA mismatch repair endonuclease MutL [Candidatus Gracilibacteria bacterium]|jgi:DNA mismatch repair protein MutL